MSDVQSKLGLSEKDMNFAIRYPYISQAGRYVFFVACAFGVGLLAFGALRALDFSEGIISSGANLVTLATFLALREMAKGWTRLTHAIADALEDREQSA